jgi:hypothetical protein
VSATAQAVRRGGVGVARLDRVPGGHAALVRVIQRTIPRLFNPSAARDLNETFELRITHPRRPTPDVLGLTVSGGQLRVSRGAPPTAGATVTIGADDLVLLATGETGWPALLAGGRLTLSGDPFLALRFPRLFDLPAEPGEPLILRTSGRRRRSRRSR